MEITASCAEGEEGYIYAGIHPLRLKLSSLAIWATETKIYMNIGNPEKAFGFSQLPNDGVGLARMEHIILNQIKAHPLALLDLQNGKKDIKDREEIENYLWL